MIDASESVTNENWPIMLEFVSSVVDSFDISARGTHIGLIVFSRDAEIQLYFNTLQENNHTATNVTKVVNNLQRKDEWSRFDLALLLAEEELFNEATGMRSEIPKVQQTFLLTLENWKVFLAERKARNDILYKHGKLWDIYILI